MKGVKGAKAQKTYVSSSSSSLSDVDLKNKKTKDDEQKDPEVKFHSIGIISSKNVEVFKISLPFEGSENDRPLFTLREGVHYQLKLTFTVLHSDVDGLVCVNKAWKHDLTEDYWWPVEQIKGPLGGFAPQEEAYIEILEEEIASPNIFDGGIYKQQLKFKDDEKRCHLDLHFSFEIKK